MASETITRNDLTNILNEVLPPTPSEYKKLLWTNPSPQSNFGAQTVISNIDLTVFDEIEIYYAANTGFPDCNHIARQPIGTNSYIFGSSNSLAARNVNITASSIAFGNSLRYAYAGDGQDDNAQLIPQKIYGIKYNRVMPPQVDNAIESFSLTAQQTNTNINSQFCYYDKNTNIVHIEFTVQKSDSSTFGSSAILNVPEAYRPSETKTGESISFINASNSTVPHYVSVSTGGDITQTISNGITHLFGLINYFLN